MTEILNNSKVALSHLHRRAVVYIRQSSMNQVRHNQESRERQYDLVERSRQLGWPAKAVQTIDEDQGRNATSGEHRQGFKKLLADIAAGQVGMVLALEASRLARSSADWCRLVEICVVTQTLLADESAVYDPRDPNDRLLLGVKGTISEAELFTLRCRLHEGRWHKARRGELTRSLPVGYLRTAAGPVVKDPDRQVQGRLEYIFRLFAQQKVARRVLLQLVAEKLRIPTRIWGGPHHGELAWREPEFNALMRILHNPTFAGAYVYGQFAYDSYNRSPTTGKARAHLRPLSEWPVCIQGIYPAYITWDQYVDNQRMLRGNWYRIDSRGAPRKGAALLQGIVFCGRCGARMSIFHYATREKRAPGYGCVSEYSRVGGATCQCMTATGVDQAVTGLFLSAVSPAKVEIALAALDELDAARRESRRQWELQLQQADYDVELARRRYEEVDPGNRLVAGELEARWEQALTRRGQLQRESAEQEDRQPPTVCQRDRQLVRELSSDLERVWNAPTTSMEDRKMLLRFLVQRVHLDGVTESGKIRIEVEWHTGAHSSLVIDRPLVGVWAPKTSPPVLQRIEELIVDHDYTTIAETLNREGLRSAKGLPFNAYTVGYIVRTRGWSKRG